MLCKLDEIKFNYISQSLIIGRYLFYPSAGSRSWLSNVMIVLALAPLMQYHI